LPHLGGVERLRDLLELRDVLGAGRLAARQTEVLQLVGELLEVLGEHLVVVPDLLGDLVGKLVEDLVRRVEVAGGAGERLRQLRREAGELGALARQSAAGVGRVLGLRGAVVGLGRRVGVLDDRRVGVAGRLVAVVAATSRRNQRERREQ
jgi:hypothetical protein